MPSFRFAAALTVLVAALSLGVIYWTLGTGAPGGFLVFDRAGVTCDIIVPEHAKPQELEAAQLIAETLATAAGVSAAQFPVVVESPRHPRRRGISVGETRQGAGFSALATGTSRLERPVGWRVSRAGVVVKARWPEDVVIAASRFLQATVQARWFIPGPLGREVAALPNLRLADAAHVETPGYLSRNLALSGRPGEATWWSNNCLKALFEHGHTMTRIFPREVVKAKPSLSPLYEGGRYVPAGENDGNWQPDYTASAAVEQAMIVAKQAFAAAPDRLSFTIGQNDTFRFDQSPATLAAVAPDRFFRHKPDYADLLFGFLSRVAVDVGRDYPDRFLTTYSYDWTENAPRQKLAANILPYLTADRSEWCDPGFVAEDQALMQRWAASGVKMFGLYDYLYGTPFFVPRPTLWAVTEPIPYAYKLGARAYYAETFSNWGLDGPKAWLAAQLLWAPRQDPAALLDEYYQRFWRGAAGPMREFFEVCDRQWRGQPRPVYWIKYYKDEQQTLLFPPAVLQELREKLHAAKRLAQEPLVRQRLEMVHAAFGVTEAFCRFDEQRVKMQLRLLRDEPMSEPDMVRLWDNYSNARADLVATHARVQRSQPLAFAAPLFGDYLRHDPRTHLLVRMARAGVDLRQLYPYDAGWLLGKSPVRAQQFTAPGEEVLREAGLRQVRRRTAHPFALVTWTEPKGAWIGRGEPFETRQVTLHPQPDGTQMLRYAGCNQESFFQWNQARPGALYAASVRVRAKVSPANMTYLIVSFLDRDGKHIGLGQVDRLPVGDWTAGATLRLVVRAPANAVKIGFGMRTLWQVDDDFAEYSQLSLRLCPAPGTGS